MPLLPGTRLGPYEIVASIGEGGMGEVYRANDVRLDRPVALKVLAEHLASDPGALARFETEAKAVGALSHPNILAIFEFDRIGETMIVVTELLEGETLAPMISRGAVPWRRVVDIGIAVAEGIGDAHAKGIIHRDLKPQNIFLTSDGRVKILDFGLALVGQLPEITSDDRTSRIPSNEAVVGSIGYMAPEQLRGESLGATSDIFSLAVVLFEAVTGINPFLRKSLAETMAAILGEDPFAVHGDSLVGVPSELCEVMSRCLAKDPGVRFQSARDLAFALRMFSSGSGSLGQLSRVAPQIRRKQPARKGIDSLAVLPLTNVSGDPDLEYLSDGLTDGLIHLFSELPRVRVMARSTVFRYKGRVLDAQSVGRELGVRAVLTGRVLRADEMLDIQCELVDVADGSRLWGERYQRKVSDVFAIQEEISSEIARKLTLRLSGVEKKRLAKRYTKDPEAYKLYLKGRFQWNKRTEEGLRLAIEQFNGAIEQDPQYALAFAGLADTYSILANFGFVRPLDGYPKAKAAARRALEIDSDLAEAHAALGFIHDLYDWDAAGAEAEYRLAIDKKGNYATARHWYAVFLSGHQRLDEAVEQMDNAHDLDPLSPIINVEIGLPWLHVRQYDRAIEEFRRALVLFPEFAPAYTFLGHALAQRGDFLAAAEAYNAAIANGSGAEGEAWLGHAQARSGSIESGRAALTRLRSGSTGGYVSPASLAVVHLGLGEIDQALACMQRAYLERTIYPQMLLDARLDDLRSIREFVEIERAVRGEG